MIQSFSDTVIAASLFWGLCLLGTILSIYIGKGNDNE